MKLIDVYSDGEASYFLWHLLRERTPEQSISHKEMPPFEGHLAFIKSRPYPVWYVVRAGRELVGSVYLTENREIGIFVLKRFSGMGLGPKIVKALIDKHPGRLLANVNPANEPSRKMFEKLGGKLIQVTYEIEYE